MKIRMTPQPGSLKDDRKEACRTFVDQTKQLLSLASAFIVVPAGVKLFLDLQPSPLMIVAEIAFILSVLLGYLTIGSVTGTQDAGEYDVYRPTTRWLGSSQILTYVAGLALFGVWFVEAPRAADDEASEAPGSVNWVLESGCCLNEASPADRDPRQDEED